MARATITVEAFVSKDPETRNVTGHSITAVSLPVTPQKKIGAGYEDSGPTVWYSAEFWDDMGGAVAQAIRKGDLVTVTGQLEVKSWEANGKTGTDHIITFASIAVVVRKPSRGSQATSAPQSRQQPAEAPWSAGPVVDAYTDAEAPF